jgi:hypothetical protein
MTSEESSESGRQTATVEIYDGYPDRVPDEEPAWSAEMEIEGDWWGKSHPTMVPHDADTEHFAEEIEFHSGPIGIWCESPVPVHVCVHTNDSYHDPHDWGKPIERGLGYGPDVDVSEPFGCEVWGRVLVWVAERDVDD